MARPMESSAKRPRISIDVLPEVRRRLRLAAAKRDLTVRQYVLGAIEERLREDLGDEGGEVLALPTREQRSVVEGEDLRATQRTHKEANEGEGRLAAAE